MYWRCLSGRLGLAILLSCFGSIPLALAQDSTEQAQLILHLLDYVAVDYPQCVQDGTVLDQGEYDEQVEFVQQVQTRLTQLAGHAAQPLLLSQAAHLVTLIYDKRPGTEVNALAQQLYWQIIRTYNVAIAPRRAPDLATAATVYQSHCAACHGLQGQGDGPAGANLDPAPRNFHERQSVDQRSVYGFYNTITLGVEGTGMGSFRTLSEDERWGLAFYVSTLGQEARALAEGSRLWQQGVGQGWFPDLASVATATASAVQAAHGAEAPLVLAYLRSQPQALTATSVPPLVRSAQLLRASLSAYQRGQRQAAQDLAVSAYLDGFELVEANLDVVDASLRLEIERAMLRYRSLLKNQEPLATLETQANDVQQLLSRATIRLAATHVPSSTIFLSAYVILLREGLEAVLVLAVILALLKKSGRRDALPYVHAGWLLALFLGGCTWVVASYVVVLSGSTREVTEGTTALVAAGMLLYVGFWMHRKACADRWQTFLQTQLQEALSRRTMWTLALLSLLAVYREAFEIVLFYQALWQQVAPAYAPLLGGLGAAALTIVVLGWLIFRGTVSLPFGAFFGTTSLLMVLLAVVFVGKGIAALQEAGTLPVYPVSFPGLPALGVYPNLLGLTLQAALVLLSISVFLYTYARVEEKA